MFNYKRITLKDDHVIVITAISITLLDAGDNVIHHLSADPGRRYLDVNTNFHGDEIYIHEIDSSQLIYGMASQYFGTPGERRLKVSVEHSPEGKAELSLRNFTDDPRTTSFGSLTRHMTDQSINSAYLSTPEGEVIYATLLPSQTQSPRPTTFNNVLLQYMDADRLDKVISLPEFIAGLGADYLPITTRLVDSPTLPQGQWVPPGPQYGVDPMSRHTYHNRPQPQGGVDGRNPPPWHQGPTPMEHIWSSPDSMDGIQKDNAGMEDKRTDKEGQ